MQLSKPIYKIIKSLFVLLVPILLILTSLTLTIANADLHKASLRSSDFYSKLSQELRSQEIQYISDKTFLNFLIQTSIRDLATPGWLQNLFEKNIDLTTKWLNEETNELNFYLPTADIELAMTKSLDLSTQEFSQKFSERIPTCSQEQSEDIKREGFDLEVEFCLPQDIKNNTISITDYFGINQSPEKNILTSVIKNNSINTFTDSFKLATSDILTQSQTNIYEGAKRLRNYFILLQNSLFWMWSIAVGALLALIITGKLSGKNSLTDLQEVSQNIAVTSLLFAATMILFIGGSSYLTSTANSFLLPDFISSKIVNLVTWELVKFSFNIVSIAIFGAVFLLVIRVGLFILQTFSLSQKASKANTRLGKAPNQTAQKPITKNPTLDEQFHTISSPEITHSSSPQSQRPPNPLLEDVLPENYEIPSIPIRPNTSVKSQSQEVTLENPEPTKIVAEQPTVIATSVAEIPNELNDYDNAVTTKPIIESNPDSKPKTPTWF